MLNKKLFGGLPTSYNRLSNEDELAELCPNKFTNENMWSSYANSMLLDYADISNWKWRSSDVIVRFRQLSCYMTLLKSVGLSHKDKERVAGWMLSKMLTHVPEYVASKVPNRS